MILTGFTLFQVPKGWQMSVRLKNETGWSVQLISDTEASSILELVEHKIKPTPMNKPPPSLSAFRRVRL